MLCTYFSESKEVGLMEKMQLAGKMAPGKGEFGNEIQVGQIPRVCEMKKSNMWKSVKGCRDGPQGSWKEGRVLGLFT